MNLKWLFSSLILEKCFWWQKKSNHISWTLKKAVEKAVFSTLLLCKTLSAEVHKFPYCEWLSEWQSLICNKRRLCHHSQLQVHVQCLFCSLDFYPNYCVLLRQRKFFITSWNRNTVDNKNISISSLSSFTHIILRLK